jgi:hypothetical protein
MIGRRSRVSLAPPTLQRRSPALAHGTTLDKDWKAYSGVAHLWLTFYAGVAGDFSPWGHRHGDWDVLLFWLAYAEDLRRQGEAWKPERAKNPVLDPTKTWRVP